MASTGIARAVELQATLADLEALSGGEPVDTCACFEFGTERRLEDGVDGR